MKIRVEHPTWGPRAAPAWYWRHEDAGSRRWGFTWRGPFESEAAAQADALEAHPGASFVGRESHCYAL